MAQSGVNGALGVALAKAIDLAGDNAEDQR
jgi:hypothetical protein